MTSEASAKRNSGTSDSHQTHRQKNLRAVLPWDEINWLKLPLFILTLLLFLFALEFMKAGARGLVPFLRGMLTLDTPVRGFGFGWLASYFVLSGSPIAAVALTFFDVGAIQANTAFSMIVGSRIGGSLIVILIGLLYVLRGHEHRTSMLTGLLALTITATIYLLAAPLGLWLLGLVQKGPLEVNVPFLNGQTSFFLDPILSPPVNLALELLPHWAIFGLGLLATVLSLHLFDQLLPELDLEENVFGGVSRLLYRPSVSFLLGIFFTFLTMSVSVSLGLLVPLTVRGYVRRENLVPYIMGCNISTFVDTLLASLLLRNQAAADIVLVQMASVLIISVLILAFSYRRYAYLILRSTMYLNRNTRRLAVFFAFIVLAPVALLLLGG